MEREEKGEGVSGEMSVEEEYNLDSYSTSESEGEGELYISHVKYIARQVYHHCVCGVCVCVQERECQVQVWATA